ncbi:MAG: recombinase family protein [Lachnospiraceae bacterium]|nr:recombinase family protein [Lachnospiraceae bacterium]
MKENDVLHYLAKDRTKEVVNFINETEHNCAYLRKSRKDREAELRGEDVLKRHHEILDNLAKQMGKKIDKVYPEVVSGESISDREEMQKLLSDVETGYWDNVFVVEVERLARGDTRDQGLVAETFKYSNTKIVTPMKTYNPSDPNDEEYFEFGLFMSRREYKTINRRLNAGRISSINEGKFVGNIPPYGYDRVKIENAKGFTLKPNDEEAKIVQLIFEKYANTDISISGLARLLNEMNVKSRKGKEWSLSTVKDLLCNPVYVGILRWNNRKAVKKCLDGEIITTRPRNNGDDVIYSNGIHEHLITDELYLKAQEKRKRLQKNVKIDYSLKNPFAGLLFCEKCGKPLTRRPYTNPKMETGLICTTKDCNNIYSKFKYVEEKILIGIKDVLESYPLENSNNSKFFKNEASHLKTLIDMKEIEITKVQNKQDIIFEAYEDGTYTKEMFIKRNNSIDKELREMNKVLNNLKSQLNAIEEKSTEYLEFLPKLKNALDLYTVDTTTITQKNKMLSELIEKITYLKTTPAIKKNSDPYDFTIKIYLKLPEK